MKSIEHFLAFHLIEQKLADRIKNPQIVEDENHEDWLLFELAEGKAKKLFKKKLADFLWASIAQIYEVHLASQLLRQGYMIVPIEGGWLCVNPAGERYELTENSCTCPKFTLANKDEPCKHLHLLSWQKNYRGRINQYKLDNGLK